MSVILDTNLWSSIRDKETEVSFNALMNSRKLRVVVAPSTLLAVVRIPVAEARQSVIHALGTGLRERLPSEAESECMEVVSEVKRVRQHWMRRMPDTARASHLNGFWTKRIWREALEDSQRLHDYELRQTPVRDYLIEHQREERDKFLRTQFQTRPLTHLMVTPSADPASYLAGWSGEPVEAWRLLLRDLYWYQLSVIGGRAVITKEDTTISDWIGVYVDLSKLRHSREDFTRFWLEDVNIDAVPRNWLRWAVRITQSNYKITSGNPADEQHSSYLFDCDLFLSADTRYISVLEMVRNDAPFTFAQVRRVSGDRDVSIVDRLAAVI
jgi:hypothetical protein